MTPPRFALTVDLEFFDSAFLYHDIDPPASSVDLGLDGIDWIVDLLEGHQARTTFFVLGEVASERPELIEDLADRGHEIASHGYSKSHPDLRQLDPETLVDELYRSKQVLEELTGNDVGGYRAPAFAVDEPVLRQVADAGFTYDSSVVPSREIPGFYGHPDTANTPYPIDRRFDVDGLWEYPVSVSPWLRVPLSGAWMRLLGRRYVKWGVDRRLSRDGYVMLYVHPWELVEVPDYRGIPRRVSWRTGKHVRRTLENIFETFPGTHCTIAEMVDRH